MSTVSRPLESRPRDTIPIRANRRRLAWSAVVVATVMPFLSACDISGAVGSKGLGCMPVSAIAADDSTHSVFADGLISTTSSALTHARSEINTTNVTTTVTGTLSSSTDVRVLDGSYTTFCGYPWFDGSNGTSGVTTCETLNSVGECDQHLVRISVPAMESPGISGAEKQNIVLHEMLHSLGMNHQTNIGDVMWGDGSTEINWISDHDKKVINAYYD